MAGMVSPIPLQVSGIFLEEIEKYVFSIGYANKFSLTKRVI
jgi:hypothetical protein